MHVRCALLTGWLRASYGSGTIGLGSWFMGLGLHRTVDQSWHIYQANNLSSDFCQRLQRAYPANHTLCIGINFFLHAIKV